MTEPERGGLVWGRKIQRGFIVGKNGPVGLFLPVPGREFAAIEREHHGNFSNRDAFDLAVNRVPATGASEAWGVIRFGQVDRLPDDLEVLRQRERRNLDFDGGVAVVAALQRQHDRRLRRAAIVGILTIIGAYAVGDFLADLGVRPMRRDIGIG